MSVVMDSPLGLESAMEREMGLRQVEPGFSSFFAQKFFEENITFSTCLQPFFRVISIHN